MFIHLGARKIHAVPWQIVSRDLPAACSTLPRIVIAAGGVVQPSWSHYQLSHLEKNAHTKLKDAPSDPPFWEGLEGESGRRQR